MKKNKRVKFGLFKNETLALTKKKKTKTKKGQ